MRCCAGPDSRAIPRSNSNVRKKRVDPIQFVRDLKANAGLVSVLALIHSLNITRSGAILFFSWTVLRSSEKMMPFASMLIIGERISMTLSASVGTRMARHGAPKSFLLGESLFIVALGGYLLVTLSSEKPAFTHAVFSYALMTFASVISYPSSQTLLRLASASGFGTRNASLPNISSTLTHVIGPALTGVVLTWFGAVSALSVCLLFAALSIIIMLALFIGRVKPAAASAAEKVVQSLETRSQGGQVPLVVMFS